MEIILYSYCLLARHNVILENIYISFIGYLYTSLVCSKVLEILVLDLSKIKWPDNNKKNRTINCSDLSFSSLLYFGRVIYIQLII